ncbi:MAG: hypothetical protein R3B84_12165 [Zavarzinella sp.]
MAKPLVIEFEGKSIDFQLEKVDRTKLYGYVETEVHDDSGKKCELATLSGDGHTIVGKGGTSLAYLSPDGLWRKKNELKAIDVQGNPITPVKSTFDAPVTELTEVSIEEYLSHNINLVYHLQAEEQHPELVTALKDGRIFQFPFSYRGGLNSSAGFLLANADGVIFLCVGSPTRLEFIGFQNTAEVVEDAAESTDDEDDILDFSMM